MGIKEEAKSWDLELLIAYIVGWHHKYASTNILSIIQLIEETNQLQNSNTILVLFNKMSKGLSKHMCIEESVLFPYISHLVKMEKGLNEPFSSTITGLSDLMGQMDSEHIETENFAKEMAQLCNNYTIPNGASNKLEKLYLKLMEFDNDLQQHLYLENELLFPKAIALEKK